MSWEHLRIEEEEFVLRRRQESGGGYRGYMAPPVQSLAGLPWTACPAGHLEGQSPVSEQVFSLMDQCFVPLHFCGLPIQSIQ